ncbi:MAG: DinB family protein [Sphingobacterium composti]|uniref:DinB family protein n=1 Tax=Sphingobacterium composti TaxID=363260 RepID=UPI00135AD999|nr:DinB family protein [Sphingobacterium composti Ten et al. 2007 non Yoo et al. 2007]
MKRQILINNLNHLLHKQLIQVTVLNELDDDLLVWKSVSNSWSILECAEHLNLYFDFYIPEIERCLAISKENSYSDFKSGIIGSYFIKLIKPSVRSNKMKTVADMNPNGRVLNRTVLNKLQSNLLAFQTLLQKAQDYDLNRVKTHISISKFIKLKLGDTLSFVVHHNERHFKQMNNILEQYKIQSPIF